jgi:hypothetical protein
VESWGRLVWKDSSRGDLRALNPTPPGISCRLGLDELGLRSARTSRLASGRVPSLFPLVPGRASPLACDAEIRQAEALQDQTRFVGRYGGVTAKKRHDLGRPSQEGGELTG